MKFLFRQLSQDVSQTHLEFKFIKVCSSPINIFNIKISIELCQRWKIQIYLGLLKYLIQENDGKIN
jgi:hypothetical protein